MMVKLKETMNWKILSDENDTSSNADSEMLLELKFSNKHSFLKTTLFGAYRV